MTRHGLVFLVFTLSFLQSCSHVPNKSDQKKVAGLGEVAKSLINNARYREALLELLKAEKVNRHDKEIQYLLASVYFFGFERHEEATVHVEKAIKLSKEAYPEAENLYGVILLDQKQYTKAIGYLKKAANNLVYMTPYFAEQNLGEAYTKLKQLPRANKHYAKAIGMQPKLCGAYLPFAKNLRQLDEARHAKFILEGFFKICDNKQMKNFVPSETVAKAYYEIGLIDLELKNYAGARRALEICANNYSTEKIALQCQTALSN